jgi:hypothetical protein
MVMWILAAVMPSVLSVGSAPRLSMARRMVIALVTRVFSGTSRIPSRIVGRCDMDKLKPGMVVVANRVITDRDSYGEIYIHAIPGTFGVVLNDDFDPKWPVISWGIGGVSGVCNVAPDCFDIYTGPVEQVVG